MQKTHAHTRMDRREFLAWAGLASSASVKAQSVGAAQLPSPKSLQDELAKAMQLRQALMVMVSLEGCAFCRMARNSHLLPLHRAGIPIVQLDMRSPQSVLDFQGRASTHDQLIKRWRISIAPTLLFFGQGGQEIAERMEGGYLPDFYGAYLQERMVKSQKSL